MEIVTKVELDDEDAWVAVWGSSPGVSAPWIVDYEFVGATDWDKPGTVKVTMWDPVADDAEPPATLTRDVGLPDLARAYQLAADQDLTHCFGEKVIDLDQADACSADILLQLVLYGEVVYS